MKLQSYIDWIEIMIRGCIEIGGLEREKAVYMQCLKKARELNTNQNKEG